MSKTRPFRFGIQVAMDPGDIPSREAWITLARKAEDLGYSTFLIADHYVNEYLPIAALMFVADATSTLRVGSCVFDNNYRHPALLAKEVAAIDWLSGGRFELGLGAGALQIDYDSAGLPFDRPGVRIRRLEESVSLIKQFFIHDSVTFAGEYYTVRELPGFPKPAQSPHPPIFIGGGGKKTLTLAAREADIVGLEHRVKDGDDTFDAFEHSEAALAQFLRALRIIPLAAISLDQFVGFFGTPGTGGIGSDRIGGHVFPAIDDTIYDTPGGLNFVTADEEGGVADHGVGEQAFVSFG